MIKKPVEVVPGEDFKDFKNLIKKPVEVVPGEDFKDFKDFKDQGFDEKPVEVVQEGV